FFNVFEYKGKEKVQLIETVYNIKTIIIYFVQSAIVVFATVATLFGRMVFAHPPGHESNHGDGDHSNHGAGHPLSMYQYSGHAPPAAPYHFEYGVEDLHAHDIKSQQEVSDGHGNVKGSYSLVEPDGSTRLVEYTADNERGFNAVVKKIGAPHDGDSDHHRSHTEVDYHHRLPSNHPLQD
ncbi:uncharacterized protein LOC111037983, partial [Myzus persicae]|uniref:uncharacterized protein LOC111037983 n=1 Tax=Myzus persicae TaxID=13164 RepID=UPI000B9371B4